MILSTFVCKICNYIFLCYNISNFWGLNMRYIDLDGVILDTEDIIFNKLLFNHNNLNEDFIFPYVVNIN